MLITRYIIAALILGSPVVAMAGGSLPVTISEDHSGAPVPMQQFKLIWAEEFDSPGSLQGPRLFAPVHAPFGASRFDGPEGPAYARVTVADDPPARGDLGALRITAYKDAKGWRSGSVQTADAAQSYRQAPFGQTGFACRGCYFEARLKFPPAAPGYWAGFWLLSPDRKDTGHVEIDIIEWYGGDPKGNHQSVHIWPRPPSKHSYRSNYVGMKDVITDGRWHTYGALQRDGEFIFYVDRREVSRMTVGPEFNVPLYAVLTLAINPPEAGKATEPMVLLTDYLRAYALRG